MFRDELAVSVYRLIFIIERSDTDQTLDAIRVKHTAPTEQQVHSTLIR